MAVAYGSLGTVAYSTNGGSSVAPTYPTMTGGAANELLLIVGQKPATANGGGVTTPSGWTLRASATAKGGYGTTLGADTGNTNLYIYSKDSVTGSESGTLSVSLTGNNVAWAQFVRVSKAASTTAVSYSGVGSEDTAAGNWATYHDCGSVNTDTLAIVAICTPTDVNAGANFTTPTLKNQIGAGAQIGTLTEVQEPVSSNGNDISGWIGYCPVTGSYPGQYYLQLTGGGTTTNLRGPAIVLMMREIATVTAAPTEDGSDSCEVALSTQAASNNPFGISGEAVSAAMRAANNGSSMKPRKVTTYTSGSGTFTPAFTNGLARVTLIGGGAGGGRGDRGGTYTDGTFTGWSGGGGGGGGCQFQMEVILLDASYAYSVGAGGAGAGAYPAGPANASNGGDTTLGIWCAPGGQAGANPTWYEQWNDTYGWYDIITTDGYGGNGGGYWLYDDGRPSAENGMIGGGFYLPGGGGGRGRWSGSAFAGGQEPGFPFFNSPQAGYVNVGNRGLGTSSDLGGGGGHTRVGTGATPKTTSATTGGTGSGYGAGGGGGVGRYDPSSYAGGGAGTGGIIIIEEFGPAVVTS